MVLLGLRLDSYYLPKYINITKTSLTITADRATFHDLYINAMGNKKSVFKRVRRIRRSANCQKILPVHHCRLVREQELQALRYQLTCQLNRPQTGQLRPAHLGMPVPRTRDSWCLLRESWLFEGYLPYRCQT